MSNNKFCFLLCMLFLVLTISFVSAARLPIVDGDSGNWGTILNEYLSKALGNNATTLNISGDAMFDGNVTILGTISGRSPLKISGGIDLGGDLHLGTTGFEIRGADGGKLFDIEIEGVDVNDDGHNLPWANNTIIFETWAHAGEENLNSMDFLFYDATDDLPLLALSMVAVGRANIFDTNLLIGKSLGNALLDENYTKCQGFNLIDCNTTGTGADLGVEDDIEAKGSIYSQENINATGNFSLGQKIFFALGEVIDNIVDGWITITGGLNITENFNVVGNATIEGNLNVTENITADWFKGNLNWSDVQNAPTSDWLSTYNTTYAGFNTTINIAGLINNTAGWILNFSNIYSDDWTNVTITENQISNLVHIGNNGITLVEANITDLQTYAINNTAGWTLNFSNIFSNDWTNITITQSQISNLIHTINGTNINVLDVNASSATIQNNIDITNGSLFQPVYPSDDGLVLYLPFSEPNGSTQYDRSPYGNDGTQTNGVVCNATLGKYGSGCSFDGTNDYVTVSSPANIPIGNEAYTLEAWINPNFHSTNGIVGWGNFGTANQTNALKLDSTGIVNYWWDNDLTVTTPNLVGAWHHIVATFDGTTRAIYLDGNLVGSDTPTGHNVPNSNNFRVGSTNNGEYFNGSIDEVRIYNRALAPEEIRTHYLRGKGFGASGAITADKFRIVNTTGSKTFEVDNTGATVFGDLNVTGTSYLGDITITSDNITVNGIVSKDGNISFYNNAGSEKMRIINTGKVGIGTSNPDEQLHIKSSGIGIIKVEGDTDGAALGAIIHLDSLQDYRARGILMTTDDDEEWYAGVPYTGNSYIIGRDATLPHYKDNSLLFITESGNVGIGAINPSVKLDVEGTAECDGSGCWAVESDIAYKENIRNLDYGLKEILELKPRIYNLKENGEENIGMIAQEFEQVVPELVRGGMEVKVLAIVD